MVDLFTLSGVFSLRTLVATLTFKAIITRANLTHNITIKSLLSKYCCCISKSFSNLDNCTEMFPKKYFQFALQNEILEEKSFYLFITISFYCNIAILCVKTSYLT